MSATWKTANCSERENENIAEYSEKPSLYVNSTCLGDVSRAIPSFSICPGDTDWSFGFDLTHMMR
jgi:hypothetical protein